MAAGDMDKMVYSGDNTCKIVYGRIITNGTTAVVFYSGLNQVVNVQLTFAEVMTAASGAEVLYVYAISKGAVSIKSLGATGTKYAYVMVIGY